MAAYLSNKSFISFLKAQDIFPSNKAGIAQHFIFDQ